MLTDLRNLPDAVRRRLANADIDLAERHRGFDLDHQGKTLEQRVTPNRLEVREASDGVPVILGYATVYDAPYGVFGGPPYGWTEIIGKGAATRSVNRNDPVYLFFDHDGLPLAATKAGTLKLESDKIGLYNESRVDPADPLSMAIVRRLQRGELDSMSFAFKVNQQRWEDGDGNEADPATAPVRRIQEVTLYDVSVVSFPANPATAVQTSRSQSDGMSVSDALALLDGFRRSA